MMNKEQCIKTLKNYLACEGRINHCANACNKCKYNYSLNDLHEAAATAMDLLSTPAVETNMFDECTEYHNCFVQVLHNSVTDEYSVGWKRE